jgi:hypothetical protein
MKNEDPNFQLIAVPRETLAELLAQAGHTGETPESFLARSDVAACVEKGALLRKAAKVASWSRMWLLVSAIASLPFLFGSLGLEGIITLVVLTVMTVVEFRVHRKLAAGDSSGLRQGWHNQCAFAACFLIYGFWHALGPMTPPASFHELTMLGGSSEQVLERILPMVIFWTRIVYATIGFAGGVGQFMLARYYRSVLTKVSA